mmetsp:Transcript_66517/g.194657  ORF Transcript_66517/g.194657 Transcript_66517/m.194657 type:complete len:249 (+) Transcript_66517:1556-2302(+)
MPAAAEAAAAATALAAAAGARLRHSASAAVTDVAAQAATAARASAAAGRARDSRDAPTSGTAVDAQAAAAVIALAAAGHALVPPAATPAVTAVPAQAVPAATALAVLTPGPAEMTGVAERGAPLPGHGLPDAALHHALFAAAAPPGVAVPAGASLLRSQNLSPRGCRTPPPSGPMARHHRKCLQCCCGGGGSSPQPLARVQPKSPRQTFRLTTSAQRTVTEWRRLLCPPGCHSPTCLPPQGHSRGRAG